jgi:hypothetical protein
MNEKFIGVIHEVRNRLLIVKGLIHFHMDSDRRFKAEQELDEACRCINLMYAECLRCSQQQEDPNDNEGQANPVPGSASS